VRLLALAAVVFSAAAAANAAAQPPTLRLVRTQPLTVAGQRFQPRERVRVVVDGRVVARASANAQGAFMAATGVAFDRCLDMAVSVIGASGDRATLEKLPKPACAPQARTS
jgi:hypothetical protein